MLKSPWNHSKSVGSSWSPWHICWICQVFKKKHPSSGLRKSMGDLQDPTTWRYVFILGHRNWGDIPWNLAMKHRPKIYARYLQFGFLLHGHWFNGIFCQRRDRIRAGNHACLQSFFLFRGSKKFQDHISQRSASSKFNESSKNRRPTSPHSQSHQLSSK